MHVVHVVRDLDVASGGPSRSVPALAEHQACGEGMTVTVLYKDRRRPVVRLAESAVTYCAFGGNDLQFQSFLNRQLGFTSDTADSCLLHLHGLWSPMLHFAAQWARARRLPYVVSTRGMLARWALRYRPSRKKVAWRLYQRRDLVGADHLLATSEAEQEDVLALLPGCDVMVIPNGCAEPPETPSATTLLPHDRLVRWALVLGRLHPVKGLEELIEAWAKSRPPGWNLALAGPDENGYRKTLEASIGRLELTNRVFLLGEVDDAQKWSLFDHCELLVAPSRTENFGMSIAEALSCGTPVITTTGTPWEDLETYDCGWWVAPTTEALETALRKATGASVHELRGKGSGGRRLIAEKYSWERVAERTVDLYRSVLS